MSVSELIISRQSQTQIIEVTAEPSCLSDKLISKHAACTLSNMTQIFRRDWELNPSPFHGHVPHALVSVLAHRATRAGSICILFGVTLMQLLYL